MLLVGVGAAVTVVAVLVAGLRLVPGAPARDLSLMSERELVRYGSAVYGAFETGSIADAESPAAIADAVALNVVGEPPDTDSVDAITRFVAEFLFHRFTRPSLDEYIEWRREIGYQFLSDPALIKLWGIPTNYEYHYDDPYPGDAHLDLVFRRMWKDSLDRSGTDARIVAIATDNASQWITFATYSKESPSWPTQTRGMSPHLWHGRTATTSRNWWLPPQGLFREWARQRDAVDVAVVAMIAEFKGGRRLPVQMQFFRDPDTGRWWHVGLSMHNVELQGRPAFVEY